jgi:hypothetical protein
MTVSGALVALNVLAGSQLRWYSCFTMQFANRALWRASKLIKTGYLTGAKPEFVATGRVSQFAIGLEGNS